MSTSSTLLTIVNAYVVDPVEFVDQATLTLLTIDNVNPVDPMNLIDHVDFVDPIDHSQCILRRPNRLC